MRVGQEDIPRDDSARTAGRSVLAVLLLVLALAAAACGGNGGHNGQASPTPPPATGQASPEPTGEAALPASCLALQKLKAYRYVAKMTLESPEPTGTPAASQPTPTSTLARQFTGPFLLEYDIDASFVAPDRFEAVISGVSEPFSMIVIGDQSWMNSAGAWIEYPQVTIPYKPADVCEAILRILDLSQSEAQPERIDSVKTLRYTFSQAPSQQAMAKIFGGGSDMDILLKELDVGLWLAEKDNWPVRIDVRSSGLYGDGRELRMHLTIDIKDANSDDIRVEPPL